MPVKYTEVNVIARPFLSLNNDVSVTIRLDSDFRKGRPNTKSAMEPGMVADVTLLRRGQEELAEPAIFEMGFGAIAHMNIEKLYPGNKKVGKYFIVTKHAKTGGGKANPMTVVEVKVEK